MKFMVDECVGPGVAKWLRNQGVKVFCSYAIAHGLVDEE